MLFQGFVHPLFLWGTLAAAVPLLIHLLNRQRHKPLQWAAMEFVLAAYRKTRRRAQLENLLLLLLRMAAVALLALAIARPFTGTNSPLASLTMQWRNVVLVLDTSASTGYRESVESVNETILARARDLLEELDGARGDRVRLYTAGARPRLLSTRSPEDALALLSTLGEPRDEPLQLADLVAELVDVAEEEAAGTDQSSIEVRFLTDLQRTTFFPPTPLAMGADGEARPEAALEATPLQRALDRLEELGVAVVVEDLGPAIASPANLGVESVAPLGSVLGPGTSAEVGVSVRNFGARARNGVRVTLEVDGTKLATKTIELIDARGRAEVVFQVPFQRPGPHALVARLEGDRLTVDDERALTVDVPAPIEILLVNGDPSAEIERDEVGVLRTILEPFDGDGSLGRAAFSPFRTRVIDAAAFRADAALLQEADLIVLANVASPSTRVFEALERHVEAGASLFVSLGDRFLDRGAIEALNTRAWRADGTGLLPAKLFRSVVVPSRREAYYRCASFDAEHPGLRFFADERWRPYLTEVPVYGFVETQPIPSARVLATLDDEGASPLLLERTFGRGRVLLWTSSIDRDWNRVADSPNTLVPLVHELFRSAVLGAPMELDVPVGESLNLEVDSFPRQPVVVAPDGERRPLDGEPVAAAEGVWSLPTIGPLDSAGSWRVEWEGGRQPFSAGLRPEEGDLERVGHDELESSHAVWQLYRDEGTREEEIEPERGELWRTLAALALACLIAETLWAAFVGRNRRSV